MRPTTSELFCTRARSFINLSARSSVTTLVTSGHEIVRVIAKVDTLYSYLTALLQNVAPLTFNLESWVVDRRGNQEYFSCFRKNVALGLLILHEEDHSLNFHAV